MRIEKLKTILLSETLSVSCIIETLNLYPDIQKAFIELQECIKKYFAQNTEDDIEKAFAHLRDRISNTPGVILCDYFLPNCSNHKPIIITKGNLWRIKQWFADISALAIYHRYYKELMSDKFRK